ncbi:hypothetical protein ACTFIZ_000457 [Dictyostelium cf. discoideum]
MTGNLLDCSEVYSGFNSGWNIHQTYPFDSSVDTPQNFIGWLGKASDRNALDQGYYAHKVPDLSVGTIQYLFGYKNDVEYIVLGSTFQHGLSDWVVGINIKKITIITSWSSTR